MNVRAVLVMKISNQPPMFSAGTVMPSNWSAAERSRQYWSRAGWASISAHHGHCFSSSGRTRTGSAARCGSGLAAIPTSSISACGSPEPAPSARCASASAISVVQLWMACSDRAPPSEYQGIE